MNKVPKVYLVTISPNCEETWVDGVFSTKEKAEEWIKAKLPKRSLVGYATQKHATVEKFEVDPFFEEKEKK